MGRKFASGKFAKGICDRCGFTMPYLEMVQTWDGLWVHRDTCWEPKHPQLEGPTHIDDPISLEHTRPDLGVEVLPVQIETIFPDTFTERSIGTISLGGTLGSTDGLLLEDGSRLLLE